MSSKLYLFDPGKSREEIPEKPLTEIMREVHIARAEESARLARAFRAWVSGLFQSRKQTTVAAKAAKPTVNTATTTAGQDRLAA
mgnify:CR=1 FL=1